MTTAFPGALDTLPRPGPSTLRNAVGFTLSGRIDDLSDAIEAIEAKLGTGASTPAATAAVLRRASAGVSSWSQLQGADVADGAIGTTQLVANAATQFGIAVGITGDPTTTEGATYVDIPNMAVTLTTSGGPLLIWHGGTYTHDSASGAIALKLKFDGAESTFSSIFNITVANKIVTAVLLGAWAPAAGVHEVKVGWLQSAGTAKAFSTSRQLVVVELKR